MRFPIIYKIGSDQIHIMDPACYTSAAAIGDKKRKQVIYALRKGIWTYDLKQDKKKRLVKWNKNCLLYTSPSPRRH